MTMLTLFCALVSCAGWAGLGRAVIRESRRIGPIGGTKDGTVEAILDTIGIVFIVGALCGVSILSHAAARAAPSATAWRVEVGE